MLMSCDVQLFFFYHPPSKKIWITYIQAYMAYEPCKRLIKPTLGPWDPLDALLTRVSHFSLFFELSYTLLTTHAHGLYEFTKNISALQTKN